VTILDVLNEILEVLSDHPVFLIGYEQTRFWPEKATAVLSQAGLLQQADLALEVECWRCPETCPVEVTIHPAKAGKQVRAVIGCDERPDMGIDEVPLFRLEQWRTDRNLLAQWISKSLGLKGIPKTNAPENTVTIGRIRGKNRVAELVLDLRAPMSLSVSENKLPLVELILVDGPGLSIDRAEISALVELPPRAKRKRKSSSPQERTQSTSQFEVGSPEWRRENARKAANAKHNRPGGSRDKKQQIREIWATGKYSLGAAVAPRLRAHRRFSDPFDPWLHGDLPREAAGRAHPRGDGGNRNHRDPRRAPPVRAARQRGR
jgi:hypothetical protein